MKNIVATCILSLGAGLVWAQDEAVPLPSVHQSGNVSYVSGGIPYEQIPAFQQARASYPLQIELYEKAPKKNEFTADADVKIIDSQGVVVLDAKADGPYMWVRLPAGRYKVQATLNDRVLERTLSVKDSGATHAVMLFPQGTDE